MNGQIALAFVEHMHVNIIDKNNDKAVRILKILQIEDLEI